MSVYEVRSWFVTVADWWCSKLEVRVPQWCGLGVVLWTLVHCFLGSLRFGVGRAVLFSLTPGSLTLILRIVVVGTGSGWTGAPCSLPRSLRPSPWCHLVFSFGSSSVLPQCPWLSSSSP